MSRRHPASLLPAPPDAAWHRQRHRRRRRHLLTAALLAVGVAVALLAAPADLRAALWHGALANPVLLILPVVFSLVALSLLWSAGQAVDSWVFLTFNLRGARPAWLDWAMLGVTQLGSGYILPPLVLALWLAPQTRLAYALALGSLTQWALVELVKAVVGRSRYCDYPPEVLRLPQVGGYVDPNLEAILALRPDLVVGARGPVGPQIEKRVGTEGAAAFFPRTWNTSST